VVSKPKDVRSELKEIFRRLTELEQQFDVVGSVGDIMSQEEQNLTEHRRALVGLEKLINMKDEVLISASELEFQLQKMKDQLKMETADKQKAEAELLKAQENMEKTLSGFAPVTKRAERLNSQVNDLSVRLRSAEEEKMDREDEVIKLQLQLEEVTGTLETLKQQMENRTAFFSGQVKELLGKLSKTQLEKENKEDELLALRHHLEEVTVAFETLKEQNVKQLEHTPVVAGDALELVQTNVTQHCQTPSQKNEELEKRIQSLEQTIEEKQKHNKKLEAKKQDLEKRVHILEELNKEMQDTQNDMQNEQDKLKHELTSKRVELVQVTTDLKHATEKMNRYKTELQQSKEEAEKYRSEREDLENQLTVARIHLKYLQESYRERQRLGKHMVLFSCVSVNYQERLSHRRVGTGSRLQALRSLAFLPSPYLVSFPSPSLSFPNPSSFLIFPFLPSCCKVSP